MEKPCVLDGVLPSSVAAVVEGAALRLVAFCNATGASWGIEPPDMYWFRHPKVHVCEAVLYLVVIALLYSLSHGFYSRSCKPSAESSTSRGRRPNYFYTTLGVLFLLFVPMQIVSKAVRPKPLVQLCWLFMPCHLLTGIWAYIFLSGVKHERWCRYAATLCLTYHWGPIMAMVAPDVNDHQYFVEDILFAVHHILLLAAPLVFASRYGLLPQSFRFYCHVTWIGIAQYTFFYQFIGYVAGMNVGYQMHPPNALIKVSFFMGQDYRIRTIFILILFCIVSRNLFGWLATAFKRTKRE